MNKRTSPESTLYRSYKTNVPIKQISPYSLSSHSPLLKNMRLDTWSIHTAQKAQSAFYRWSVPFHIDQRFHRSGSSSLERCSSSREVWRFTPSTGIDYTHWSNGQQNPSALTAPFLLLYWRWNLIVLWIEKPSFISLTKRTLKCAEIIKDWVFKDALINHFHPCPGADGML